MIQNKITANEEQFEKMREAVGRLEQAAPLPDRVVSAEMYEEELAKRQEKIKALTTDVAVLQEQFAQYQRTAKVLIVLLYFVFVVFQLPLFPFFSPD